MRISWIGEETYAGKKTKILHTCETIEINQHLFPLQFTRILTLTYSICINCPYI